MTLNAYDTKRRARSMDDRVIVLIQCILLGEECNKPSVCPTKDRAASLQHFACYSGLGDEICFMFGSSIGIVNSSSINRKGLLFAENGYRSKQLLCDGLHLIFHELRCNL